MTFKALILTGVLLVALVAYTEAVAIEEPTCPTNYDLTYYGGECQCRCRSTNYCPKNYIWNSHKCKCVCKSTNYCPPNSMWDPTQCTCVCKNTNYYCPQNYYWDKNQCKCVCNSWGLCSSGGYTWDPTTCGCKYTGGGGFEGPTLVPEG